MRIGVNLDFAEGQRLRQQQEAIEKEHRRYVSRLAAELADRNPQAVEPLAHALGVGNDPEFQPFVALAKRRLEDQQKLGEALQGGDFGLAAAYATNPEQRAALMQQEMFTTQLLGPYLYGPPEAGGSRRAGGLLSGPDFEKLGTLGQVMRAGVASGTISPSSVLATIAKSTTSDDWLARLLAASQIRQMEALTSPLQPGEAKIMQRIIYDDKGNAINIESAPAGMATNRAAQLGYAPRPTAISPEDFQARAAAYRDAKAKFRQLVDAIYPNGIAAGPDRTALAAAANLPFDVRGVPGTKGRLINNLSRAAITRAMYATGGKQLAMQEMKNFLDLYMPSVADRDEDVLNKLQQMETALFTGASGDQSLPAPLFEKNWRPYIERRLQEDLSRTPSTRAQQGVPPPEQREFGKVYDIETHRFKGKARWTPKGWVPLEPAPRG